MPNLAVDVNSWARLACYPRGNFYPLSHGPSIRYRGITLPDFRPCSNRISRSQAPLCQYTPRVISIHPEGTFGRLRYLLGGDRPSQTAHQALSTSRFHGLELGPKPGKSGISLMAPSNPKIRLPSLPPILRIRSLSSMPGYSKAPRGLFVLSWVIRIFTDTSISPSPSLRQRPSRYAIRAGRNLPDKEFRYLRTVIVTAAVHRGFGSDLSALPLTFRHWAGVSPYTSPFSLCRDLCFC